MTDWVAFEGVVEPVVWGKSTYTVLRLPDAAVAALGFALSVVPALWGFIMVNGDPANAAVNLWAGFAGLLMLDWFFAQQGLAPAWWMRLRVLLSAVVLTCLAVPILLE